MDTPWLKGLNPDQKRAVASRAKRLLITAGAGSGKTFVIVRRIGYLIQNCGVKPENILAITFTRNAAREMAERLREALEPGAADTSNGPETDRKRPRPNSSAYMSRFNVRTFHSLCYLMLRRHWRLVFDRPFHLVADRIPGEPASGSEGRKTKSEMLKAAVRSCLSDPDFRIDFKRYLWDYLIETGEADRFGGLEDPRYAGLTTLAGIKVRSYAERDIANWLHQQGIVFLYNQPVSWSKRRLRPDFYLPEPEVYIEVWDCDDPGSMTMRREKIYQYRTHGKRVIEVERNELLDFSTSEKRLRGLLPEFFGAKSHPKDSEPKDLERLESPEAGYPEALNSFISLAEEVLDKLKNHSVDPEKLTREADRQRNRRTRLFYRLFMQIYRSYRELLQAEGALDFNDLILQTVELLKRNPPLRRHYRSRWSHVLVDEYQDVNTPQVLLLKELVGPGSHLTCVGDDWQSIYGFRGSNVGHIQNFSAEFPGTRIVNLRLNYRSGASIVGFSSHAIRKCKRFTDKQLIALNRDVQPIVIHRAGRLYTDGIEYVASRILELVEQGTYRPQDILILYRRSSSFRLLGETLRHLGLKTRHETIHGAKGLEAPCVFLWGLTGGRGGFPRLWRDKSILRLILPQDVDRRMDEERRIFYVALTRARERLFLLSEKNNASEFLIGAPPQYFQPQDGPGAKERVSAAPADCPQCEQTLLPRWRFCPFCYHGLETYSGKLT